MIKLTMITPQKIQKKKHQIPSCSERKKKKEENNFGVIEGYDSDVVLMNRALQKFFSHSGKYLQRKGRLKKQIPSYSERKKKGNTCR